MNPLQKFILAAMDAQHVNRSELVKKMGYTNISKGLRKLDEMMETLEGSEWILPLLQDALHIPDEKLQNAVSGLEDEIFDQKSATFKPYIQVILTNRPNFFSVAAGIMHIQVPENTPSLSDNQQISIVRGLCRAYREKFSGVKTKGFIYHRHYGDSVRLDNYLSIVKR